MQVFYITSIVFSIGAIISDFGIRFKRMIDKLEIGGKIGDDDLFMIWFPTLLTIVVAWIPLINAFILMSNIMEYIGLIDIE